MSASTPAAKPVAPGPGDDRPFLESRHRGLLMVGVMGVSVIQFVDLTIANVALPHMQTSLGASIDSISWVLTSFIIAGVLVLPLTGWLSDRLGSRNLFLGAVVLFLVSSALCGTATSLTEMVVFRAIQGVASALMGPLAQTVMFDVTRPSRQAQAMSVWGMVVMIGPLSGPFLGGYLTEQLNWRWVFYVNLPVGIPALALLWWLLPSRPNVKRRLDFFGAALLGLALCAIQLLLDRGNSNDWFAATESVIEVIVAVSALWMFAVHSRHVAHPLFDGRMVWNGAFLNGLWFMAVMGIVSVALSSVLPTMFQNIYHYSVLETGELMAPRGLAVLVSMMITGYLIDRVDPRVLITTGYAIAAVSLWMMTRWSLDANAHLIVMTAFIQGLGLGLIFVPVNLMAFSTLAPHYRTDGSTLMMLVRNLGSSFGISAIVTTLSRNMQISHSDIAASVTSFNLPGIDPAAVSAQLGPYGSAAMALLEGEVTRQAAFIAYLDNFYILFWMVVAVIPMAWLVRRPWPVDGPLRVAG